MTDLLAERRKSIELRLNGIPELVINQEGGKLEQFKTPSRFFGPRVSSVPSRLADAAMATGRAVAGGVQDAVKGVVSTADDIGTFIDEKTGGLGTIGEPTRMDEAFEQGLQNLNIKVPEGNSAIEQLGRGLVQFAAGMGAAPVKGASLLANMGRGAFADALFDPEEGNLSTLLNEFDLGNAVTEYLDSSVDDEASAAERLSSRLKNSLEGAGLGGLGAVIGTIVKGFRAARSDEGLREAIKGKLQAVVDRLNQPGEMPTVGANFANIPAVPFANLRERYSRILREASDGKDPNKVKLTPDRMEKAKQIATREFDPSIFASKEDYENFKEEMKLPTKQMVAAKEFVSLALASEEKVKLRMPDGERGSIYVKVGDKGTVRFADHAQPTKFDDKNKIVPVGGFSTKLNRRHGAATLSVDPETNISVQDAFNTLFVKANGGDL